MASPKLRFKEFDGDWNSIAIGKFLKIKSGLGFKAEEYSTEQEIRLLQIENVGYGAVKWTHNVKFVPTNYLDVHKDLVLKEGDLLLALNRPVTNDQLKIAKLTQEDSPSILYQRVGKLDFLKEDIDKEFIFQIFKKDVKNYVLNSSIGSDQPFISTTDLYKHKLCIPLKEEQTKIASFLSAVDEKISQLTQKHTLLSQYKQGMMQKLFSQQLRFKADDGSEFGEWENKTLSNFIIKHIGGASLKPSDFVEQSEYEVIPKKAIVPNGYLNLDKDNPTYCSEDFFKANLKNTVDNTYLVTVLRDLVPSGPSIGYIVKYMENTQYILAQGVYGFKLKEELNKDFLIHFSNTKAYRLVMQSIMVGSTQVHIRNQDFFGIEIPVPCLEEQTKIANFLSAIDQKIEVVAQQIEQAKTWKKGLLQQMFV